MSPYLFLICAQGLSSLLQDAEARGNIEGVTVARRGTRINYLLFADDCVIFNKATIGEWYKITILLSQYESTSGQTLKTLALQF